MTGDSYAVASRMELNPAVLAAELDAHVEELQRVREKAEVRNVLCASAAL